MTSPRWLAPCLALLLAACGGGGGVDDPRPAEHTVPGRFVLRVIATPTGHAALEEKPAPYRDGLPSAPIDRRLRIAAQGTAEHLYAPPEGWSLIDVAAHPSGEFSAVLATHRELRLLRLTAQARVLTSTALADGTAPNDPYFDHGGIRDDSAMQPLFTRDAVRVAALGEDLAVATRTGRHAVVAYRYAHAAQGYERRWRRLVEPGTTVMARYLASGSHDTYGQLANHFQVLVAASASGDIAVAVPASPHNGAFAAHAAHYFIYLPGPPRPPLPEHGAIVTRLDGAEGSHQGATFIDTGTTAQVYALRALPSGGWAIAGRQHATGPEGGWNGFAAWLDGAGRLQRHAELHVEHDDVLFDIAPLPGGRYLAAGATGYRQSPAGASISDDGAPLLAVLDADGRIAQRLPLPAAPGQNPVRSLDGQGPRWLAAGMRGGPGTHTADADPARLLRADGFVREVAMP